MYLTRVQHLERQLSRALHGDDPGAFERIRAWFAGVPELHEELEQLYRIALMGLAGRALRLAAEGRLADPEPYLDAARGEYGDADRLADDTARALALDMRDAFSWSWWELEGTENKRMMWQPVHSQRYPLLFFSLRLLELTGELLPELDLHGEAQGVLGWFTENAESLEPYVRAGPEADMGTRRKRALAALEAAVRRDEAAGDEDVIRRPLSGDAVAAFTAGVYAAAYEASAVDWLFARAGAARHVPADSDGAPEGSFLRQLLPKEWFTDNPAGLPPHAARDARSRGKSLAADVLRQLCGALDGAQEIAMPLQGAEDFTPAADAALAPLAASGEAFLVLAGDWSDILPDQTGGELARYRGRPVLWDPDGDGDRRLYAVEPNAWGCLVRAPTGDGPELRVEVNPVSAERAAKLLGERPDLLADKPDGAARLRKVQTYAEILVAQRVGFRVRDPSRARCVRAPAASA